MREVARKKITDKQIIKDFKAMQKQKLNKLFESHYEELEETRNSGNTEGLRKIAELGNRGQYKESIKEAKLLLKKYPDLDYLYLWLGISYFGLDDYKNAHSILIE